MEQVCAHERIGTSDAWDLAKRMFGTHGFPYGCGSIGHISSGGGPDPRWATLCPSTSDGLAICLQRRLLCRKSVNKSSVSKALP